MIFERRGIALLLIPALLSAECQLPALTLRSPAPLLSCLTEQAFALPGLSALTRLTRQTKTTLRGVLGRGQSGEEVNVSFFQDGVTVTNIGNSWQWYAEPLAIINLVTQSQSGTQLGMNEFYSYVGLVAFFAFGVIWAKRVQKLHIGWVQIIRMIKPLAMAILMWTGHLHIGQILLLSFLTGLINAYGLLAFQSFNNSMINKKNEGRVIGGTSRQSNLGRFIGFGIAVVVNTHFGLAWYFMGNALSFVAFVFFLWLMDFPGKSVPAPSRKTFIREGWNDLRDFLLRVRRVPRVSRVLVFFGLAGVLGFPLVTLMPDLTSHQFHYSDAAVGWLRGAFYAGGALAAHSYLRILGLGASEKQAPLQWLAGKVKEGKWIVLLAMVILGSMSILFPSFESLPFSILILSLAGISYTAIQLVANHAVQTDPRLEGVRHMAFGIYTVALFGAQGLGNYWAAKIIPQHSTSFPLVIFGSILILMALLTSVWDNRQRDAWTTESA